MVTTASSSHQYPQTWKRQTRVQRSSQIQGRVVEWQALDGSLLVTKPCGNHFQVPRKPNRVDSGHRSYVSARESASRRVSSVTILVEKQTKRQDWSLWVYKTRFWCQKQPDVCQLRSFTNRRRQSSWSPKSGQSCQKKLLYGWLCKIRSHSRGSSPCLPRCENNPWKERVHFAEVLCNNEVVTRSIPEKDRTEAKSKNFEAEPHTSSLMGMQWIVENDTLEVCSGAEKEVPNKITQRAVLSFAASVFEPLGLFAPFTMRLLTTIWAKSGQQWDDKIEVEDERSIWNESKS